MIPALDTDFFLIFFFFLRTRYFSSLSSRSRPAVFNMLAATRGRGRGRPAQPGQFVYRPQQQQQPQQLNSMFAGNAPQTVSLSPPTHPPFRPLAWILTRTHSDEKPRSRAPSSSSSRWSSPCLALSDLQTLPWRAPSWAAAAAVATRASSTSTPVNCSLSAFKALPHSQLTFPL